MRDRAATLGQRTEFEWFRLLARRDLLGPAAADLAVSEDLPGGTCPRWRRQDRTSKININTVEVVSLLYAVPLDRVKQSQVFFSVFLVLPQYFILRSINLFLWVAHEKNSAIHRLPLTQVFLAILARACVFTTKLCTFRPQTSCWQPPYRAPRPGLQRSKTTVGFVSTRVRERFVRGLLRHGHLFAYTSN